MLLLHQLITAETGGDPNIRDVNLLESALESAFVTFDGQELYPTKDVTRVGLSVAAGTMVYEELLEWIRENRH